MKNKIYKNLAQWNLSSSQKSFLHYAQENV